MLKSWFQELVYRLIDPFVRLLIRIGVTANALTLAGFLSNLAALYILFHYSCDSFPSAYKGLIWGGGLVLLGGLFDIFDGRVARQSGKESKAGALFDSVIDRYAELAMFLGLGWFSLSQGQHSAALGLFLALSGSLMVSYTRARSEALGVEGAIGLFQRPERIVLLSIGAMAAGFYGLWTAGRAPEPQAFRYIFEPLAWIVAAGALVTALQRLVVGYRHLRR